MTPPAPPSDTRPAGPIGLLHGTLPDLARFAFTDSRARSAYPGWDDIADEQVAALKHGPFRADPHMVILADELAVTAGDDVARRVGTVPGLPKASGLVNVAHPEAAELRLAYETLELPVDDDQRPIVHLPADEVTSAVLDRLNSQRPRALGVASA
jgi:hypothetical protein